MAHTPVMLEEVLKFLNPQPGGVYVDATFGRGGYTRAILNAADCHVIAIDRDKAAITAGTPLQQQYGDRLTLILGRFGDLPMLLETNGTPRVDGVVFDLGVSSPQLDEAARGFSFTQKGPLDMRMGQSGRTAKEVVNEEDERTLTHILRTYGEEKFARKIAQEILTTRAEKPFETTLDLVAAVHRVIYPRATDKIDPATRTFQALRIFVNEELTELEKGLAASEKVLKPDGAVVVVSFHSLEDRIVKIFLQNRAREVTSRLLPTEVPPPPPSFSLLTKKPARPTTTEAETNPRSRSAKVRAATRTANPVWRAAA